MKDIAPEITTKEEPEATSLPTYVIVTPARNEAAFIEMTLQSVIAQTVLPLKWVIVSDGSTDGTDEIVNKYVDEYDWIELVRMPERAERNFAGKVYSFNEGLERVKDINYDIICNVDADISFSQNHFEFLMGKFAENSLLGVAGTSFIENSTVAYNYNIVNIEHVSGQCQLFRRECFAEIGGYQPIKGGGVDWTAVTTARMKGWKTRTFTEHAFVHHRKMGTGTGSILSSRFRFGKQDYYLGGHPLWEIFRCLYQMKSRPYVIGGIVLYVGYLWGYLSGTERPISQELVEFRRKEQIQRLKMLFSRTIRQEAQN